MHIATTEQHERLPADVRIRRLASTDVVALEALSATFGEAFPEPDTYTGCRPGAEYLRGLLTDDT